MSVEHRQDAPSSDLPFVSGQKNQVQKKAMSEKPEKN